MLPRFVRRIGRAWLPFKEDLEGAIRASSHGYSGWVDRQACTAAGGVCEAVRVGVVVGEPGLCGVPGQLVVTMRGIDHPEGAEVVDGPRGVGAGDFPPRAGVWVRLVG